MKIVQQCQLSTLAFALFAVKLAIKMGVKSQLTRLDSMEFMFVRCKSLQDVINETS